MKTRKKTKSFALALRLRARAATLLIAMLCCVTGAWADHEVTIDTNVEDQQTYTSGDVTIAFSSLVDEEGGAVAYEDTYPMTISVSSGVIKSVVLRLGFNAEYAESVHTSGNVGTRTISPKTGSDLNDDDDPDNDDDDWIAVWQNKDTWVTFSGINASSVTIYSDEGVQIDEVKVTYADVVAVNGVSLSSTSAVLNVGQTTTLTATVSPGDATNKAVTWSTSNPSVATVTDGVVTAVGAGTATITVTATNGTVDTSDDKTATCTVTVSYPTYNLTANEGATGEFWATFYSDASNYQASSGTKVFAVNLTDAEITMTEISDGIVKSGEGVVLKNTSASITMTPTASAGTGDWTDNSLTGTMTSITNPGNAYVLNKKEGTGVGFYRLSSGGTIGANKAYLTYSGTLAREFFLFDEATGISATLMNNEEVNGEVYDLQGRRVSQPTKGLYIVNGKKYIKK